MTRIQRRMLAEARMRPGISVQPNFMSDWVEQATPTPESRTERPRIFDVEDQLQGENQFIIVHPKIGNGFVEQGDASFDRMLRVMPGFLSEQCRVDRPYLLDGTGLGQPAVRMVADQQF